MADQSCLKFRQETTHCGYSLSLIKSAMIKWIRRGNETGLIWVAQEIEMLIRQHWNGGEGTRLKAIMTNIYHRIIYSCIEDVTPRCVQDVNLIMKCIRKWWIRINDIGKGACYQDNLSEILDSLITLARLKKSRCCSHLRAVIHPLSQVSATDNMEISEEERVRAIKNEIEEAARLHNGSVPPISTRIKLVEILGSLYREYLGITSDEQVAIDDPNIGKRRHSITKKRHHFNQLWRGLISCVWVTNNKALSDKIHNYKTIYESKPYFREEFIVLVSGVESILAVACNLTVDTIGMVHMPRDYDHKELSASITFDEGIRDIHVKGGNRSMSNFLFNGACVENEDMAWTDQDLKRNYESVRMGNGEKKNRKRKVTPLPLPSPPPPPPPSPSPQFSGSSSLIHLHSALLARNEEQEQEEVLEVEEEEGDRGHRQENEDNLVSLVFKDNYILSTICTPKSRKSVSMVVRHNATGEMLFVKEHNQSTNNGLDQYISHHIKRSNMLGLNLNVPDKQMVRECLNVKYDRNKGKFTPRKSVWYTICGCLSSSVTGNTASRVTHDYNKFRSLIQTADGFAQLINILIYRLLMGFNDTNLSNMLIMDDKLYSVDENTIGQLTCRQTASHRLVRFIFKQIRKYVRRELRNSIGEMFPSWLYDVSERNDVYNRLINYIQDGEMGSSSRLKEIVTNIKFNFDNVYDIILQNM